MAEWLRVLLDQDCHRMMGLEWGVMHLFFFFFLVVFLLCQFLIIEIIEVAY